MEVDSPLLREYCKKFESRLFWLFKLVGYLRLATEKGKIVRKNATTAIFRCIISVLLGNSSAFLLFYVTYIKTKFLIPSEVGTLVVFAILQTCILINIAGPNRNSAILLLKHCIKIDTLFGVEETKFMRDIIDKTYLFLTFSICIYQTIIGIVVLFAYTTTFTVKVIGSIYFTLLFLIFNDVCFLLTFYVFLALRVHYINVAIIKKADLKPEYFPKQFLFDGILWKDEFDDLVIFHNSASPADYVEAYKEIFKLLRQVEKCYRFTVFMGMNSVTGGTFVCVPSIIYFGSGTDFTVLRLVCVCGWIVLGWLYEALVSQQTDLFCRQIDKTKLLCTYIQLKPNSSDEILKLSKSIIYTLKIREPQLSIYGMYFFNTGLVFRTAAAIFVYITVELQVLIPV